MLQIVAINTAAAAAPNAHTCTHAMLLSPIPRSLLPSLESYCYSLRRVGTTCQQLSSLCLLVAAARNFSTVTCKLVPISSLPLTPPHPPSQQKENDTGSARQAVTSALSFAAPHHILLSASPVSYPDGGQIAAAAARREVCVCVCARARLRSLLSSLAASSATSAFPDELSREAGCPLRDGPAA